MALQDYSQRKKVTIPTRDLLIWVIKNIKLRFVENVSEKFNFVQEHFEPEYYFKLYERQKSFRREFHVNYPDAQIQDITANITSLRIQNSVYAIRQIILESKQKQGFIINPEYDFKNPLLLGGRHDKELQKDIEIFTIIGLLNQSRKNGRSHTELSRIGEIYYKNYAEKNIEHLLDEYIEDKDDCLKKMEDAMVELNNTSENIIVKKFEYCPDKSEMETIETITFYALIPSLTKLDLNYTIESLEENHGCKFEINKNRLVEKGKIDEKILTFDDKKLDIDDKDIVETIKNELSSIRLMIEKINSKRDDDLYQHQIVKTTLQYTPKYIETWEKAHVNKENLGFVKEDIFKKPHLVEVHESGLIKFQRDIYKINEREATYHYREVCKNILKDLRKKTIISDIAKPGEDSGIIYYKAGLDDINFGDLFKEIEENYLKHIREEMFQIFSDALRNMWTDLDSSSWKNFFSLKWEKLPIYKFFEHSVYSQTSINRTTVNFLLLEKTVERINRFKKDFKYKNTTYNLESIILQIDALLTFYKELASNLNTPTQTFATTLGLIGIAATIFAIGISIEVFSVGEILKVKEHYWYNYIFPIGSMIIGFIVSTAPLYVLHKSSPVKKIQIVLQGLARTLNIKLENGTK